MRRALRAAAALLSVAEARRAHAVQVTIGSGASLSASGFVRVTQASVPCMLSDGSTTSCLQVTSQALPDHPIGPWCDGAHARGAARRGAAWRDAAVPRRGRAALRPTCGVRFPHGGRG